MKKKQEILINDITSFGRSASIPAIMAESIIEIIEKSSNIEDLQKSKITNQFIEKLEISNPDLINEFLRSKVLTSNKKRNTYKIYNTYSF
ncbi:hypothetical protein [Oenococcus oeni]|uniref:hypothetical protein n=1 Tax=Oenococcus oeni TaxID=1247 RepID=UPI0010B9A776|nr:hypothetical protein [Oenococcus oeni]SYW14177.1 hypothetical protein OENI_370001 [Oenococcus oeni]